MLLVVWYDASGKSQQAYVLAFAGLVGFVVAMILVGLALGMASGEG
ncbi:MAG: hypothetical protein ABI702_10715 [Burkholderiales bacterium]